MGFTIPSDMPAFRLIRQLDAANPVLGWGRMNTKRVHFHVDRIGIDLALTDDVAILRVGDRHAGPVTFWQQGLAHHRNAVFEAVDNGFGFAH